MTHDVFVYGILLKYATRPAVLHGWRLAFSGNATVREDGPDSVVLGGIVHVDDSGLAKFDQIEGYRPGAYGHYYDRRRVEVETERGTEEVWVYRMEDDFFVDEPVERPLAAMLNEQYERLGHYPVVAGISTAPDEPDDGRRPGLGGVMIDKGIGGSR